MSASALKAAATGQIPQREARNPYEHLKHQLEVSRGEFAKLVGSQANADKFIRVTLNAVLANPDLLDASRQSLIAACMKAAQDGLLPDGREAVLNIYSTRVKRDGRDYWEKRAQYLPMVGGLVKKLYAGGDVTYVDAAVVYRGDVFKFQRGDEPRLVHEPALEYPDESLDKAGNPVVVAAYCVVKLKNGEIKREVMTRRDIDKVRAASKSPETGPWATWFEQMAIKSVIKRIYRQLPHSDAFDEIEKHDNEVMGYAGLGESAAEIAGRALEEREHQGEGKAPAALENAPSETLEPSVPADQAKAHAIYEGASQSAADVVRAAAPQKADMFDDGATSPSAEEQALATEIEVKLRAARSKDALNIQADRARALKDEALRLRLDEIYTHEVETRFS